MLILPPMQKKLHKIHTAITEDNVKELSQLMDRKRFVSLCDGSGLAPIHKAVLYEQADILRHILQHHPRAVNSRDNVSGQKLIT